MNQERLIDVGQAAKKLNVSPGTIRNFLRDPSNPLRGTKIGRCLKVYESTINALIKHGEEKLIDF